MVMICCLEPTSAGFDVGDVKLMGSLSTVVNYYSTLVVSWVDITVLLADVEVSEGSM